MPPPDAHDPDAANTDDFARYCCGDPDCPNDCEREQPPVRDAALSREEALLLDAQQLLRRMEFLRYGARTHIDERPDERFVCPVCGWPEGGHRGPGRIKGNAENTHEAGCSMYAALHGELAPRLAKCSDRPSRPVIA